MYNNLVYFLVVLFVFTTYQPADGLVFEWVTNAFIGLGLFLSFWMWCRSLFTRLTLRIMEGQGGSLVYQRLVTRLTMVALAFYTIDVFFLGLKDFIVWIPLAGRSEMITGLLGLGAFGLYLSVLWGEAHRAYRMIYSSRLNRGRFVFSQLRLNLPILIPFLILSLLADLAALWPYDWGQQWLDTTTGEIVFVAVFMSVLVVLFPALIRPLWGLKPLPAGPKREAIEKFCNRTGFNYSDIMLWPLYEGEGLTAGVMGMVKRWRYILITKSLLALLDEDELDAVMAHELGHVKLHHLGFYLFFFLGYLVAMYSLFDLSVYLLLISNLGMEMITAAEGDASTLLTVFMSAPVVILLILYFRFIFGAFMRNFERQADLYAYRVTGTISGLVSSLEKIALFSGQSRDVPSWHHFSVAQRVDFLQKCEAEPTQVNRHNKKVRLMIVAYVLVLVAIWMGGQTVSRYGLGGEANRRVAVNILKVQIERDPHQAQPRRLLGDVYYEDGSLDLAQNEYEIALALAPNDPEIMNNLAWTLVTKENPSLRDKSRALVLAERAAEIKPAAHILDTLAEALYVNGRFEEALAVGNQAMEKVGPKDDQAHFEKQLEKFEQALDEPAERP
jgi:Zn-dependent protease with chaperone function